MKIGPIIDEALSRPRNLLSSGETKRSGVPLREVAPLRGRGGSEGFRHEVASEERSPALMLAVALGLLRRQIWMIAAITLAGAVLTAILVSSLEKSYTATALLMLDQRSSGLLDGNSNNPVTKLDADGEVEILKSDNIALRVVERLQLAGEPAFDPKPGALSKFISTVRGAVSSGRKPTSTPSPTVAALRVLMQNVVIRRRGLTDVIAVEATFPDPQRAADVANAYAEAYLEEQVDAKLSGIERAGVAVSRRLAELDEELKKSETQIGLRQIYQDNLQRLKAISQRRETVAPDTRIASKARPPDSPSFPRTSLFLMVGGLASFGAAFSVAYLRDAYSRRIQAEEEVELLTGTANLASVPDMTESRRDSVGNLPDYIVMRPRSVFAGAIRRLYFNLQLMVDRGTKLGIVLVTSAERNEGTSTVALSLARTAALAGLNVVIVDCDLRNPSLHKTLDLKNEVGLVDLLTRSADERTVVQSDRKSSCKVITTGKVGNAPTEWLLHPERVRDALRKLETSYDVVILDTPPIGATAEPLIFMRVVDVALFVVRAGATTPHAIRSSLRQLGRIHDADLFTALTYTSS
jgi:capsular exopolysaccharide synthesis family protein